MLAYLLVYYTYAYNKYYISRGSLDKLYDIDCCFVNMFRLDDRTDEGSQGIEERLRRGGLIRDEGRRTDRPPDPMQERPCRQALRE